MDQTLSQRQQQNQTEIPNHFFEMIDCPVCGSERQKKYFDITYGELLQKPSLNYENIGVSKDTRLYVKECDQCGFIFVNPRVRPEYAFDVYNDSKKNLYKNNQYLVAIDEEFYIKGRKAKLEYISHILEFFSYQKIGRPLKVLDFGAGFGHTLSIAKNFAMETYGVDIDETRIRACQEQGFNVCAPKEFDQRYPDFKADIVIWQSNIEHLVDLNEGIEFIKKHCADGAVIYVDGLTPSCIKNDRRKGIFDKAHFVEHINYFPLKVLYRYMLSHGFTKIPRKRWLMVRNLKDVARYLTYYVMDRVEWIFALKCYLTGSFGIYFRYHKK